MSFTFRKAIRENVGLILVYSGGTGSGKTFTAMQTASGIAGDKQPFAVIDTEAGRAKHYADRFRFDHGDMKPPFSPKAYEEAILAADAAGYPVIVVDSMSHEHAGEGGILDMHEAELDRMAGDDWKKREAVKMAAWIKPKTQHKHMVQRLLQVRAHIILCLRAEEKIEMVSERAILERQLHHATYSSSGISDEYLSEMKRKIESADRKVKIVPKKTATGLDGWVPICEKSLPFEATASFLLLATSPGVPLPIKLQEQHRALFPLDKPITEDSGRLIAQWAAGAAPDWAKDIEAAATRKDIAAIWNRMPTEDRAKFVATRDARLAQLEKPATTPI